jgi:hypothetical protein
MRAQAGLRLKSPGCAEDLGAACNLTMHRRTADWLRMRLIARWILHCFAQSIAGGLRV